jgi:hypothetical protein
VPTRDQIAVPAQHGIRAHDQVQALEHMPRESVRDLAQHNGFSTHDVG